MSLRSGPHVRSREPWERERPDRKWAEGPRLFKRSGRPHSQGRIARHLRISGPLVAALNEIGWMAWSNAR